MTTQYRVVWQREGMDRPKSRKCGNSLKSAERLVGLLTSDEPWKFLRDTKGKGPDDYWCCSGGGYDCDCRGITVRQWCEQRRVDLPPVLFTRIESRKVEPFKPHNQGGV